MRTARTVPMGRVRCKAIWSWVRPEAARVVMDRTALESADRTTAGGADAVAPSRSIKGRVPQVGAVVKGWYCTLALALVRMLTLGRYQCC